ncbi:serine/threonine-protein kinase [Fortiea contorta]|uniref:serine/threonine-protein kinase n=1 Tax=Fortiea contorta TaxID=1892405 RepID=UPI00034D692D|nr:serine/threonine-protein kinase [Fortiea contorta]
MNSQLLDVRYRILTVLSAGEVAQTYLVEDTSLDDSLFILKQLRPASNNPQALKIVRRLFASEAITLEKIGQEHDQIQKLVAYFEENEEFYLVQEFIPGNSLVEEILSGTPLTEEEVIILLTEILEILAFVHSHKVIHQDIKPANIIRRKLDQKLVLIDFGTVREIVTTIVGNLEYIPVEQLHGNSQYNSDIYALGIVGIAALMGLTANEIAILPSQKNLVTGEIVWRHRNAPINKQLAKIIDKMVRFDYRKRYQSATEVLHDLQQLNNPENEKQNLVEKKLKLMVTGIAGCIAVSVAWWLFWASKPVGNAQELYQQGVEKYQRGNYQGAVGDLTEVITISPQNALAYNRRGDAFYRLGNYEKARADASRAIRLNPQDGNAYYDRAFALYGLEKYPEAIADYTKAIKLNSQSAYAYYGRGMARAQIRDYQGSAADFSTAIALQPSYAAAYVQRGIIHRRLRQKQAAIEDFDTVIDLNPNDAQAYYQRGLTQFSNQQKYIAINDFTKAINLNPKYIEAYLARGNVHSELANKLEATADYNQVVRLNPKLSTAYLRRGIHRFSFGDYRGALQDYAQAIKLNPQDAAAYNHRGEAYLQRGNQKAANQDYSQAIKVNPQYALAYYNRGLILAKQGNKQAAIKDFQQAAKLFQKKGNEDGYQDVQLQIRLLQS